MNNAPSSVNEPEDVPVTGMFKTTADEVRERQTDPATSHVPGSDDPEAQTARGGVYNAYINGLGIGPVKVAHTLVSFSQSEPVPIPAGFYLLSGGTGGGKSITAAGLLITASYQGVPVRYVYCYEARTAKLGSDSTVNPYYMGDKAAVEQDLAMMQFISELPNALSPIISKVTASKVGIVVIDSIALPMRAYRSRDRQNMATMKEGLQPMDIAFVVAMEEFAVTHHLAIFGVINDDLVPFASKLEGMSEGIATIHSPGVFSVRSRFDRRVRECVIDDSALDAAGEFLHYPPFNRAKTTIWGTDGL